MSTSSYVHGSSVVPLLGDTIGAYLDMIAARYATKEALVSRHQGVRLTYGELHAEVERVARGLLGMEVKKGDRVGIWSPNNVEWVIV